VSHFLHLKLIGITLEETAAREEKLKLNTEKILWEKLLE
jgi:hypothetical protein